MNWINIFIIGLTFVSSSVGLGFALWSYIDTKKRFHEKR
jgi:hypothetical protein